MSPFEHLIHELGAAMDITLHPDAHESCRLFYPGSKISIQIDLDTRGDQILIGTQLGKISSGTYREQVFTQALRTNGTATTPRGILAFSEKNDTLVLFQFLDLASLSGASLHSFLQLFHQHALAWTEALERGEVPELVEAHQDPGDPMYGLRR